EVERRAPCDLAPRRLDHLFTPGFAPAFLYVRRKVGRCIVPDPSSKEGPKHAVDQPPWAAVHQWQSGCDERVIGRAKADLLCERDPKHHSRLAVIGQTLARRAV